MDEIEEIVAWQLAGKPSKFHVCSHCSKLWTGDGAHCPACDLAQ